VDEHCAYVRVGDLEVLENFAQLLGFPVTEHHPVGLRIARSLIQKYFVALVESLEFFWGETEARDFGSGMIGHSVFLSDCGVAHHESRLLP
jgi:hypothetical protein